MHTQDPMYDPEEWREALWFSSVRRRGGALVLLSWITEGPVIAPSLFHWVLCVN